ncbi:MAG TPA: hypothetical protein VF221_07540 [Chloroflexota bacterium]
MTDEQTDDLGFLGMYGVLVVPAPTGKTGGWFVTLSAWDDEDETYIAGTDGPIFESREEAMQEANRIVDWLAERSEDENLMDVWAQMQQMRSEGELWPDGRPGKMHYQW